MIRTGVILGALLLLAGGARAASPLSVQDALADSERRLAVARGGPDVDAQAARVFTRARSVFIPPLASDCYSPRAPECRTLERRARSGDSKAMIAMGLASEINGRWRAAKIWYRRAAEAGSGEGMARLAQQPNVRDVEAAIWLQKGAATGDPFARLALAQALRGRRYLALQPDPAKAEALYEALVAEGSLEAMKRYADWRDIDYHPGDQVRARQLYEQLLAAGQVEAIAPLARLLREGRGGPADPVRARALFEAGVRAYDENWDAWAGLLPMLEHGVGGPADPERAAAIRALLQAREDSITVEDII